MKKQIHPGLVAVAVLAVLAVVALVYTQAANSPGGANRKPPPQLMEQYKQQGKSMFPTTIPGKYGGTLNTAPVEYGKPAGK